MAIFNSYFDITRGYVDSSRKTPFRPWTSGNSWSAMASSSCYPLQGRHLRLCRKPWPRLGDIGRLASCSMVTVAVGKLLADYMIPLWKTRCWPCFTASLAGLSGVGGKQGEVCPWFGVAWWDNLEGHPGPGWQWWPPHVFTLSNHPTTIPQHQETTYNAKYHITRIYQWKPGAMHEKKPDPGEDSGMVPNLLLLELEAQIGTLMVKRSNGQTLIILWFFAGSVVPLVPTQRATSLLTKNIDIMPNTLAGTTTLPSRFNANHQEPFGYL